MNLAGSVLRGLSSRRLRGVGAQDIRVTSIEDSHGGASEELSARSAEFDL